MLRIVLSIYICPTVITDNYIVSFAMTISVYVLTQGSLLHDPLVSSCVTNDSISKYELIKSWVVHQESPHTNKYPKMSPKLVDNKLLGLE